MEYNITEIIPDDMPEWSIEAMAEGQLFNAVFKKIKELETSIENIKEAMREVKELTKLDGMKTSNRVNFALSVLLDAIDSA